MNLMRRFEGIVRDGGVARDSMIKAMRDEDNYRLKDDYSGRCVAK